MAPTLSEKDDQQATAVAAAALPGMKRYRRLVIWMALLSVLFFLGLYRDRHWGRSAQWAHQQAEFMRQPAFPAARLDPSEQHPIGSIEGKECILKPTGRKLAPIHYHQTPKSHPIAHLGDNQLFTREHCFTFEERFAPYQDDALGSSFLSHLTSLNLTWTKATRWNLTKEALIKANSQARAGSYVDWSATIAEHRQRHAIERPRTAVVLRLGEGHKRHLQDDIINTRALVAELALRPTRPFDVHILLLSHDRDTAMQSSYHDRAHLLLEQVAREFWGLVTVWTEKEMEAFYPKAKAKNLLNRMEAHNSYRSSYMPLQKFHVDHPEYDYIWNWEPEMRPLGTYDDVIDKMEVWAEHHPGTDVEQPRSWLIGSETVEESGPDSGKQPDLITLNPIFKVEGSGWYWSFDVQPNATAVRSSARAFTDRTARFSSRLLETMHEVNGDAGISMHCETFPATLVQQSHTDLWKNATLFPRMAHLLDQGPFKASYVPHPVHVGSTAPSMDEFNERIQRPTVYGGRDRWIMRHTSFFWNGSPDEIYRTWKNDSSVCWTPTLLFPIRA